jgi:hypothetical protein
MVVSTEHISPIVALIAGFLILIFPSLLNYVIALYLIIIGLVGLNGIYHSRNAIGSPSVNPFEAWYLSAARRLRLRADNDAQPAAAVPAHGNRGSRPSPGFPAPAHGFE